MCCLASFTHDGVARGNQEHHATEARCLGNIALDDVIWSEMMIRISRRDCSKPPAKWNGFD